MRSAYTVSNEENQTTPRLHEPCAPGVPDPRSGDPGSCVESAESPCTIVVTFDLTGRLSDSPDTFDRRHGARGTPLRSTTTRRFDPAFPLSVGSGPVLAPLGSHFWPEHSQSPVKLSPRRSFGLSETVQKHLVQLFPNAGLLPLSESAPACNSTAAAPLLWKHLTGEAAL
jgi:hypothetical protein